MATEPHFHLAPVVLDAGASQLTVPFWGHDKAVAAREQYRLERRDLVEEILTVGEDMAHAESLW